MNSFDLFGNPTDSRKIQENATYGTPGFHLPPDEMEESVEEDQRTPPSLIGIRIVIACCALVLGLQCFRLQVTQGALNRAKAEGNSIRLLTIPADRGLIMDAKGKVLAQNTRQLALAINPQNLPALKAERKEVYALLKQKAGIDDKTIDLIEKNRLKSPDSFPIKTHLTQDESLLYQEWFATTPGVTLQEIPIRQYSNFPSMGHILGYVGQASDDDLKNGATHDQLLGKAGIEQQYEGVLSGISGKQKAEVDAFGDVVRTLSGGTLTQPGKTLKLSLDEDIQKIVADSLQRAMERRGKTFGDVTKKLGASAVIMDPNNGAIISMVSLPDYDGRLFADGISHDQYQQLINNPANPLLNRVIQGLYPSGSVIKPIIAAGALQAGTVQANRVLDTPAALHIGEFSFPDWKTHGLSDIRKAIAQSNDIFFYALGGGWIEQNIKGLGIDALNKVLNTFGMGRKTGIDLPGESPGLTPGPEWKEKNIGESWYIGDTYHQSIGQGYLLATPLQMAAATMPIANGGTLYQPQLGWSLTDQATGEETLLPHKVINSNWISPQNLKVVQEGMKMTTQPGGTAQLLGKFGVVTAGKTGTAEFGNDGLTHSWYTGYAPADNPKYVFAILLEGDGKVTESGASSEPVVEEILRALFDKPLAPGQLLDTYPLIPASAH